MKISGALTKSTLTVISIIGISQILGFFFFVFLMQNALSSELFSRIILSALAGMGISLIVIIFAVSFLYNRKIRRPLTELSTSVDRVGAGDLTVSIPHIKTSPFTTLTDNFNALIFQLRDAVYEIHSAARVITAAIEQIKLYIEKVSVDTNSQFNFTEKVILTLKSAEDAQKKIVDNAYNFSKFLQENMSALTQINSTVEEITENTEQSSKLLDAIYSTVSGIVALSKEISKKTESLSASTAQTATSVAEIISNLREIDSSARESTILTSRVREVASVDGMMSVANAMEGMEQIAESVNKSFEMVNRLGAKSKNIEKIISVITNVTKQTNLLSLNAAILAEQAGEHGKGFSVIAEEIKTLSDKTASSAKEITGIINTLLEEVALTISVTQESAQIVERGNTLIVTTGEAFREVIDTAKKSDAMAKVIQRATEEQVTAISQMDNSIEVIQMIVEQVEKATGKQQQESEMILNLGERLKDIAAMIRESAQEQSAAAHHMSKGFDIANEDVKNIINTSVSQEKINKELLLMVDNIKTICYNTATITQELTDTFNKLYQEAERLKRDTEGFKFE